MGAGSLCRRAEPFDPVGELSQVSLLPCPHAATRYRFATGLCAYTDCAGASPYDTAATQPRLVPTGRRQPMPARRLLELVIVLVRQQLPSPAKGSANAAADDSSDGFRHL